MTNPLPVTAILACLAVFAPLAASAQTPQNAQRINAITGACGQTLALTYTLAIPIDSVPVAPLTASTARGEPFYLEFSLATETRLAARTSTQNDTADPYLTVFGANGEMLAGDDDSAGGFNAFVDLTLGRGTYCAQVRPYGSPDSIGDVTLTLATGEAAAALVATIPVASDAADFSSLCTDPARTAELGRALAPGLGSLTENASLAPGGRQDWRLSVTADMPLQIDASSAEFDTLLVLVDGDANVVAQNDDGPNGTDSQLVARLAPGDYCLSLSSYDGLGGAVTLSMTDEMANPPAGPIETACTDPSLTRDFGTALAPGMGTVAVAAALSPNGRNDWRVEVSDAVELQFDAKSFWIDTLLYLVDANGNILAENDDGMASTDSRIVYRLAPGRYCLALASYTGEGGEAELIISDQIEPEPVDMSIIPGCSQPELTTDIGQDVVAGMERLSLGVDVAAGSRRDFILNLPVAATVQIDANSGAFDTMLRLADASDSVVAENDDSAAGTDSRIETVLGAGRYCLMLEGFAGGSGAALLGILVVD